jgi:hypothetical protein
VIQRRHVNQESPGQCDVAGNARAFLAQRFLGDLYDDFLALLQHVRDQLRAPRLLRTPMVAVSAAVPVLRTPSAIIAPATTIAAATTRRILHARTEIAAHARLERLLRRRWRALRGNRAALFALRRDGIGSFEISWHRFGRRDHAFFFGCSLFLFELLVLGILRVLFTFMFFAVLVAMVFVRAGIGRRIRCSKHAILRISRCVIILRVGNMFGQRGRFFFGQIHMRMLFVMPGFVRLRIVVLLNFRSIT